MFTYVVAFLSAFAVATSLTFFVRNRAIQFGWLDQATDSRKVHVHPIPRLGGIAIVAGFFAPLSALLIVNSGVGMNYRSNPSVIWGLFLGGLSIASLGLFDDLRGSNARIKFVVQTFVAIALYVLGFRIEALFNPFGGTFSLGPLALPLTVLWIVGVINAMNLIDGLDGLAGGVAFFGIATNLFLALGRSDQLMSLTMASLGGAVLGFLVFNFNPATIFMGDTGSMFLGFVLAATSIKTNQKSGTAVAMLVPIVSLGLPIMDTLLAMVRRTILGRPMFSADKEHIHHRLISRFAISHRQAVLLLYGLCCVFGFIALALSYANGAQSAFLLVGMGLVVVILMRKLGYLNFQQAKAAGQTRKKNLQLRSLVSEINFQIARAQDGQEVWSAMSPLAEVLDVGRFSLELLSGKSTFELRRGDAESKPPFRCDVEIKFRDVLYGTMTLIWHDGRLEVNRDEELAVDLIADAAGRSLAGRAHAASVSTKAI